MTTATQTATRPFAVIETVTDRAQQFVGNKTVRATFATFVEAEAEMLRMNESANLYDYNVAEWNGSEYVEVEW